MILILELILYIVYNMIYRVERSYFTSIDIKTTYFWLANIICHFDDKKKQQKFK